MRGCHRAYEFVTPPNVLPYFVHWNRCIVDDYDALSRLVFAAFSFVNM